MDEKEILDLLAEAKEYIARLISGFERIAAELQEEDASGMMDFADGADGVIWMAKLIGDTGDYHVIKLDGAKLNQSMEAVNSALEEKDYVKTADIILLDIVPILKEWHQGLI